MDRLANSTPLALVRCAIYTRKSTDEGLEQEFNSLMAQREASEAYILSQREQGWQAMPAHYDDGGFSGGNVERPALKRLLADIEANRVDCVVVYKVDRLSRSLLDFAGIIGMLDKHAVTFVSVTQQFNTHTSLGRLTLNILLSFAQFEREIISERTRDKIYAARRKGKWTGGLPVLGYDVDPAGGKLNVNAAEAGQLTETFRVFVRKRSLIETLYEIERSGIRMKSWTTRKGARRTGSFTLQTLRYLLLNPIYIGKIRLKGELHEGEHAPIIPMDLWHQVQELLGRTNRQAPRGPRQHQVAMLRGLLYCEACGTPMVPTYTSKKKQRFHYYTCLSAQKRGRKACPTRSLAAEEIERSVLERIIPFLESGEGNSQDAVRKLVKRVLYCGATGEVRITLLPASGSEQ